MAEDLGRSVLRLDADPAGLRRTMAIAKSEAMGFTSSVQSTFNNIGQQMSRVGQQMAIGVTLPVLAAGKAIVSTGVNFEKTLNQIVGLTDVTREELGDVKKGVLELAAETGESSQELAEGFYFVASAGFNSAEAMGVMETAAKAAAAGLGRTSDVAKVLGLTINAYGRENITAARAGDILVAAVKDGTAEADAFAGVLGRVIPTAATLGVSFDQVAGSLAAMTLTGLSADEASTSLNQVLVSLLKPTNEAEQAMAGMGLTAQGLRDELREKGLIETLRHLQTAFEGNDEAAGEVFGNVRALRGVLALLTLDSDQLSKVMEDTSTAVGDLDEGYAETEGSAREFGRIQADIDRMLIDLSEDVLPTVVDLFHSLADIMGDVTDGFKSLPEPVRRTVVQIAALAALAGPILVFSGAILTATGSIAKFVFAAGPALPFLAALAANLDKVNTANKDAADIAAGGDPYKPIADFADKAERAGFLPIWLYDVGVSLGLITDPTVPTGLAADAEGLERVAHKGAMAKASLGSMVEMMPPLADEYRTLEGVVKTWADQSEADHQRVLEEQVKYTSDALAVLQGFRKAIEDAYSAALNAELDFERTTVAIATKQAELTALDKDYVKHKGTMSKLEIAEYRLRRHEIVAEMNALKLHLALIGDDQHKQTALTALLTSKDMHAGLTSKNEETQAAYRALRDEAILELQRIESKGGPAAKAAAKEIAKWLDPSNPLSPLNDAASWGQNIGRSYVGGIAGAIAHNTYLVKASLAGMRTLLESGSPPKSPDNPLHLIDQWGEATGRSWVESFVGAISVAAGRVRDPLAAAAQALTTPMGLPMGLSMAAASAGLGGTNRTVPTLPAQASDVARAHAGGPLIGVLHVDARGHADPEAVGAAVKQGVGDAMAEVFRDQSLRGPTEAGP